MTTEQANQLQYIYDNVNKYISFNFTMVLTANITLVSATKGTLLQATGDITIIKSGDDITITKSVAHQIPGMNVSDNSWITISLNSLTLKTFAIG